MTDRSTWTPADWRNILSDDDRQSLGDKGYLLIRAAADAAAIDAMRTAWVRRMDVPDQKRGNNDGPAGLETEPAFRLCLDHPYVMSAVAHVLDGDVAFASFRGRNPSPGSGQQGFHVDAAGPVPPDRQSLANAFWMLDDMDESNGATRLVPGTHRLQRIPGKAWLHRDARHPDAVSIRARAGDTLVFSAHLWHAGSKNLSGVPRRIAMAHFARRAVVESQAQAMGEGGPSG